jgi:hypothetical protein
MEIKAGELTQEHTYWINLSDPDDVGHSGKQICGIYEWRGKVAVELDHGMLYKFQPDTLLLDPDDVIEIEEWAENE